MGAFLVQRGIIVDNVRKDGVLKVGSLSSSGATSSCTSFRWYWVSWFGGVLKVGTGNQVEQDTVIVFDDSLASIPIKYLGISSSPDSVSDWSIPGCFYLPGSRTLTHIP